MTTEGQVKFDNLVDRAPYNIGVLHRLMGDGSLSYVGMHNNGYDEYRIFFEMEE